MDAKPQRLGRAFRPRVDENAPVEPKVIHQRYKSTGALAMTSGVGLKAGAGAQRVAFGDVSNIARNLSRDDSAIGGKNNPVVTIDKAVSLRGETKPVLQQRPSQRMQHQLGSQPVTGGVAVAITKMATTKQPSLTSHLTALPSNTHKSHVKRDTTIFKDAHAAAENAFALQPVEEESQPSPAGVSDESSRLAREEEKSDPSLLVEEVKAQEKDEESGVDLDVSRTDEVDATASAVDEVIIQEAGIACASVRAEPHDREPDASTAHTQGEPKEPLQQEFTREALQEIVQERDNHPEQDERPEGFDKSGQQNPSEEAHEVEEYWLDEEDEHYEDDDGYTTARSFRSRGDNTTGGPTLVLIPKMNARIRRELATAKQVVEMARSAEEVEEESWDTTMVAEYGDEIFQYMRELEARMSPNAHYMDNQTEIQWSMRSILMDWLIQVHHRFSLLPETLFLSVNYVDRFLSCKIVSLGKLQLVGATALLIAAKYEEINCPSLQEIVYMVDGGYTMDEILKAERYMLSMLQFELGWPGPMSFLRRISKADDYDLETRTLAKYFLEVTIMDERFVGTPPSFLAAGAHCLARLMLKKGNWSYAHVYYSNYTFSQIRQLLSIILDCCQDAKTHHGAVYDKYSDRRYKRAALFVETEMDKGFRLPDVSGPATVATAAFCDSTTSNDNGNDNGNNTPPSVRPEVRIAG